MLKGLGAAGVIFILLSLGMGGEGGSNPSVIQNVRDDLANRADGLSDSILDSAGEVDRVLGLGEYAPAVQANQAPVPQAAPFQGTTDPLCTIPNPNNYQLFPTTLGIIVNGEERSYAVVVPAKSEMRARTAAVRLREQIIACGGNITVSGATNSQPAPAEIQVQPPQPQYQPAAPVEAQPVQPIPNVAAPQLQPVAPINQVLPNNGVCGESIDNPCSAGPPITIQNIRIDTQIIKAFLVGQKVAYFDLLSRSMKPINQ